MTATAETKSAAAHSSLEDLRERALKAVAAADSLEALDRLRVEYLGRKGGITEQLKTLGALPAEARKSAGQVINEAKQAVQQAIDARQEALSAAAIGERLRGERIDVTLPARPEHKGGIHPVSQALDEIIAIFADLGFEVAEGPDIEDDFHNFTALNFPPSHPAREMHDTFFLHGDGGETRPLLRTHTSPVQIRAMRAGVRDKKGPPFRLIAPGRTYRCDSDQTHTPMFHQVEGLAIGKDIHMGHLKGCIGQFLSAFFEVEQAPLRFRPSFFPFTEPSAEVDIACRRGKDELRIGEGGGWLEVMGCGMVHPNVLRNCGIDPGEWRGFAFGAGIDRLAMLKYGIPDLRTFFESDIRWLSHYGFDALDIPNLARGLSR